METGEQPPGSMPPAEALEAFYWLDRFGVPLGWSLDEMPAILHVWLPQIARVVDSHTGGRRH